MKRFVALFAGLVFAVSAAAQTAKVIQLSPEDAAQAKSLYAQKADIEKQISALNDKIKLSYATTTYTQKSTDLYIVSDEETCGPWTTNKERDCHYYKSGFEAGFEFSEDFKFIVPKPAPTVANYPIATSCPVWATGVYTSTDSIR